MDSYLGFLTNLVSFNITTVTRLFKQEKKKALFLLRPCSISLRRLVPLATGQQSPPLCSSSHRPPTTPPSLGSCQSREISGRRPGWSSVFFSRIKLLT